MFLDVYTSTRANFAVNYSKLMPIIGSLAPPSFMLLAD